MESLVALALSGAQVVPKKHPMKSAGVAGRLVRAPGAGASPAGAREGACEVVVYVAVTRWPKGAA